MPVYTFECKSCHCKQEDLVFDRDGVEARCKRCGGVSIKVPSSFSYKWQNGTSPAKQDERDYAWKCFNEPNPANPQGMSDQQMVEKGLAKTKAQKY